MLSGRITQAGLKDPASLSDFLILYPQSKALGKQGMQRANRTDADLLLQAGSSANSPNPLPFLHLKCSYPLVLTVLLLAPQACGKVSSAQSTTIPSFSALGCEDKDTWKKIYEISSASETPACLSFVVGKKQKHPVRVQLMTQHPANGRAKALAESSLCHQMERGTRTPPLSLTILPCCDRHKYQMTDCKVCFTVAVLLV